MANMADITNSCSSRLTPSGPTPSIKQTAIPTQLRTRARFRGPWGTRKGREGRKKSADGGGWMRLEGRGASRVGMLSPPDARTEMLRPCCTGWSRDLNRRQEPAGPFWAQNPNGNLAGFDPNTFRVQTETRVLHKCSHK